jgi:alpha-beta hydrolase superfamily lysophospholipase
MKQRLYIKHIPAVLWGEKLDHIFIAVHGNQSNKEDDAIAVFAECAVSKGYAVISFDLPDHGERKDENVPCKAQNAAEDLGTVMRYARKLSENISVFACSIGAYFSLLAYHHEPLQQALFLSPLVDMERMIGNMMTWFHVSEDRLRAEQEIATPVGQPLYWDYYCYVKEHPINAWNVPTAILCGKKDDVVEIDTINSFSKRFHADLQFMEHGEHYFHTKDQLAFFRHWCEQSIKTVSLFRARR